jgi:hypothetical protein
MGSTPIASTILRIKLRMAGHFFQRMDIEIKVRLIVKSMPFVWQAILFFLKRSCDLMKFKFFAFLCVATVFVCSKAAQQARLPELFEKMQYAYTAEDSAMLSKTAGEVKQLFLTNVFVSGADKSEYGSIAGMHYFLQNVVQTRRIETEKGSLWEYVTYPINYIRGGTKDEVGPALDSLQSEVAHLYHQSVVPWIKTAEEKLFAEKKADAAKDKKVVQEVPLSDLDQLLWCKIKINQFQSSVERAAYDQLNFDVEKGQKKVVEILGSILQANEPQKADQVCDGKDSAKKMELWNKAAVLVSSQKFFLNKHSKTIDSKVFIVAGNGFNDLYDRRVVPHGHAAGAKLVAARLSVEFGLATGGSEVGSAVLEKGTSYLKAIDTVLTTQGVPAIVPDQKAFLYAVAGFSKNYNKTAGWFPYVANKLLPWNAEKKVVNEFGKNADLILNWIHTGVSPVTNKLLPLSEYAQRLKDQKKDAVDLVQKNEKPDDSEENKEVAPVKASPVLQLHINGALPTAFVQPPPPAVPPLSPEFKKACALFS